MSHRRHNGYAIAIATMLGGCGHLQAPIHPELPPVSAVDVPQLKSAEYVAMVEHEPPLSEAMSLDFERGVYQCRHALAMLDRTSRPEDASCPNAIVDALRSAPNHALVVIDAKGTHVVTDHDLAAFVGGIDRPDKALLAVLVHGYGLVWMAEDGKTSGVSATAGFVKSVAGGYEVLGGAVETEPLPGSPICGEQAEDPVVRSIERSYQMVWQVDHAGTITTSARRLLSEVTTAHQLDCNAR